MAINLESYVDVAERIRAFKLAHPDGSLQPENPAKPYEIVVIGDATFVAYTAAAYRRPDDERPGIGVAWEPFPGKTPYTRDSELMNVETSAWGRAIVAALAADTQRIASREEVANRQAPEGAAAAPVSTPTPAPAQTQGLVLPYGKDKGKALTAASTDNLQWVSGTLAGKFDDPRYGENNRRLFDAIHAELEAREIVV